MYTFIKRVLNIPFVKFVITAGINTCFGYCTYAICLHLFKQNINLSVVVSTVINILFNFKTYSKIVFKSNDNSRIFKFFWYLCHHHHYTNIIAAFTRKSGNKKPIFIWWLVNSSYGLTVLYSHEKVRFQ